MLIARTRDRAQRLLLITAVASALASGIGVVGPTVSLGAVVRPSASASATPVGDMVFDVTNGLYEAGVLTAQEAAEMYASVCSDFGC